MENNPIYEIIISDEAILDYNAVLFCLTKFFAERNGMIIPTQAFLKDIEFNGLDEFADKVGIVDKNEFIKFVNNNELFKTVKPRLLFLFELDNLLKFLDNSTVSIIKEHNDDLLDLEKLKKVFNFNNIILKNKFLAEDKNYIIFETKYINAYTFTKQSHFLNKTSKQINAENLTVSSSYEELVKNVIGDKFDIESYKKQLAEQFIYKYDKSINNDYKYISLWHNHLNYKSSISLKSKIVNGFKRGSKMLGVPTANMEMTDEITKEINNYVNGVYMGYFNFEGKDEKYMGVLSIGYNPYFDNMTKTIEVYLIDYDGDDFYGEIGNLEIIGYLRSEAAFENFSELVTAITYDIIVSKSLLTNYLLI
jgi:riboflavin kinase